MTPLVVPCPSFLTALTLSVPLSNNQGTTSAAPAPLAAFGPIRERYTCLYCLLDFPSFSSHNGHTENKHPREVGGSPLECTHEVMRTSPQEEWEDVGEAEAVAAQQLLPHPSLPALNELHKSKETSKRPRPVSNITPRSPLVEPRSNEQQEEKVCVICMDEPRGVVFNCSHCACCRDCANQITRCPLCRTLITLRQHAPVEARRAVGFASCMAQRQHVVQQPMAEAGNAAPAADNSSASLFTPATLQAELIPYEPDVSHIIIALDRSRSMRGRRQEMLDSVNEFIWQQQLLPNSQQARITVLQFASRPSITFLAQPLMDCRELTLADYEVRSGTALYDSLMFIIHKFRQCENAVVAVITDGVDTSSRAADQSQVANSIATVQRTMGWQFHYLCVDVEGALQGRALGFDTTTRVRPERLAASVSRRLSSNVGSSRASMSRIFS